MTFSWGVVHTVSPLTVIEDGSSNALPVIQSLVDPSSLTVGDMVRVELAQGGRVVVYGHPGGDPRVGVNEGDIADLARGQDGIPFAMAAGEELVTGDGVGYAEKTVTLPSGRFTQTPIIVLGGTTTGSQQFATKLVDESATEFTIRLMYYNNNDFSSTYAIQWHAIQMTSASGAG